jgi:tetratricopeptide (TPR) repeat protein
VGMAPPHTGRNKKGQATIASITGVSFVHSGAQHLLSKSIHRFVAGVIALGFCSAAPALVQNMLPFMNAGPDSGFAQIDFAQMYLEQMNRDAQGRDQRQAQNKELVDAGIVSTLDLVAPNRAVEEYNHANTLLKGQNSKEAIKHLQRAVDLYPKFVSAHVGLGLAYIDQDDDARAKSEFETAAKLDAKFPGSCSTRNGESRLAPPQGHEDPRGPGPCAK